MSTRKTGKAASPRRSHKIPAAVNDAELPATCAMLGAARIELLERIDQAKEEVKAELGARIDRVEAGLHEVNTGLHEVKADLHEVKAEVSRVAFLVEDQNRRNKVVMDALVGFIDRQDRLEKRMDGVEDTVRSLASPPAA